MEEGGGKEAGGFSREIQTSAQDRRAAAAEQGQTPAGEWHIYEYGDGE